MRFVINPVHRKVKGVHSIVYPCFSKKKHKKNIEFLSVQKHRVPEGSRKVRKGFPEAVPEGFLCFAMFFSRFIPD